MIGRTSFIVGVFILAGISQGLLAQPSINAGGIVSNATYQAGQALATGTLVSIFGTQMASTVAYADSIPLATTLANTSVSFNGIAAPLLYVSSGQINAQLPYEVLPPGTGGTVNVTVSSNGKTSVAQPVLIGAFSPGIFMINQYAAAVITTDPTSPRYGAFAAPVGAIPGVATFPAVTNDVLTIYAAGLGAVTPSIQSGHTSTDALRNTTTKPTVLLNGNIPANVAFSGLNQYFVGLYQVNIIMPQVTPGNSIPLQIQMGGITSPASAIIAVTAS
jgi:uncharacterized protein (TIGR03437 family)